MKIIFVINKKIYIIQIKNANSFYRYNNRINNNRPMEQYNFRILKSILQINLNIIDNNLTL